MMSDETPRIPPPLPYGMFENESDDDGGELDPPPPISNECIVHSPSHKAIGVYASSTFSEVRSSDNKSMNRTPRLDLNVTNAESRTKFLDRTRQNHYESSTNGPRSNVTNAESRTKFLDRTRQNREDMMNNESRTRQNHDSDRSLDGPRSDVTTVHRTRFLDKTRAPLPILPKRYNDTRNSTRFSNRTTPDTKTHFKNQVYSEETLKQTLALYSSPTHSNTNARSPIHESLTRIKNALDEDRTIEPAPQTNNNLDDLLSSINRMQCHIQRMRGSSKIV